VALNTGWHDNSAIFCPSKIMVAVGLSWKRCKIEV